MTSSQAQKNHGYLHNSITQESVLMKRNVVMNKSEKTASTQCSQNYVVNKGQQVERDILAKTKCEISAVLNMWMEACCPATFFSGSSRFMNLLSWCVSIKISNNCQFMTPSPPTLPLLAMTSMINVYWIIKKKIITGTKWQHVAKSGLQPLANSWEADVQ